MRAEEVGLLAMGSHEERHGAALPPDTDARIASYLAREVARKTGVKFIGVLRSSYELPGIDTGNHQDLDQVIGELRTALRDAKKALGLKAVVVVNGHGGNGPVSEHIPALEVELGLKIAFNSKIIELEGAHAGSEELSIGAAVGITDESKLAEHSNFKRYPEVGFVGLRETRRRYGWAEKLARDVEERGFHVDRTFGKELLDSAIADIVKDIRKL